MAGRCFLFWSLLFSLLARCGRLLALSTASIAGQPLSPQQHLQQRQTPAAADTRPTSTIGGGAEDLVGLSPQQLIERVLAAREAEARAVERADAAERAARGRGVDVRGEQRGPHDAGGGDSAGSSDRVRRLFGGDGVGSPGDKQAREEEGAPPPPNGAVGELASRRLLASAVQDFSSAVGEFSEVSRIWLKQVRYAFWCFFCGFCWRAWAFDVYVVTIFYKFLHAGQLFVSARPRQPRRFLFSLLFIGVFCRRDRTGKGGYLAGTLFVRVRPLFPTRTYRNSRTRHAWVPSPVCF